MSLWDKNENIDKANFDMKKLDLLQLDVKIYEPLKSLEVMGVDKADSYKWDPESKSPDFSCPVNPPGGHQPFVQSSAPKETIRDKLAQTTTMLHRELPESVDTRK